MGIEEGDVITIDVLSIVRRASESREQGNYEAPAPA